MKTLRKLSRLRLFALLSIFMFFAFTVTSCMVLPAPGAGKPGKHKGHRKVKGKHSSQNTATPWESVENSKV